MSDVRIKCVSTHGQCGSSRQRQKAPAFNRMISIMSSIQFPQRSTYITLSMASPTTPLPAHLDKYLIHHAYTGYFGIRTTPENFDARVNWHLSFFNGTCVLHNDVAAFITYNHGHHRLVILKDASLKSVSKPEKVSLCGIYHIAFILNSLADLATKYEQTKAKGIESHRPVNHGISTSMYYYDPDGNEFEMQVDNYDSAEEVFEFMKTEEFMLNPIGVDFRPEEFVKWVKGGEDERAIKHRPVIGKRPNWWVNSIYFRRKKRENRVPHGARRSRHSCCWRWLLEAWRECPTVSRRIFRGRCRSQSFVIFFNLDFPSQHSERHIAALPQGFSPSHQSCLGVSHGPQHRFPPHNPFISQSTHGPIGYIHIYPAHSYHVSQRTLHACDSQQSPGTSISSYRPDC
jgi:hypothetical protein